MNWKLTLIKALVGAGLTLLAVVLADVQNVQAFWAPVLVAALEVVRDLLKLWQGAFAPK